MSGPITGRVLRANAFGHGSSASESAHGSRFPVCVFCHAVFHTMMHFFVRIIGMGLCMYLGGQSDRRIIWPCHVDKSMDGIGMSMISSDEYKLFLAILVATTIFIPSVEQDT